MIAFPTMIIAVIALAGQNGIGAAIGYGVLVAIAMQIGYGAYIAAAALLPTVVKPSTSKQSHKLQDSMTGRVSNSRNSE